MSENSQGFLPSRGNYRELPSYRKAEIIFDSPSASRMPY
jgi:hypothetical protein